MSPACCGVQLVPSDDVTIPNELALEPTFRHATNRLCSGDQTNDDQTHCPTPVGATGSVRLVHVFPKPVGEVMYTFSDCCAPMATKRLSCGDHATLVSSFVVPVTCDVHVIPSDEVNAFPFAPTATNRVRLGAHTTALRPGVVAVVRDVHEVPLEDVMIPVPLIVYPATTNNPSSVTHMADCHTPEGTVLL